MKRPRDVAYIINGTPVTYAERLIERKARQKKHLAAIMACHKNQRRAAHVWTFFVPGLIYGGWHLYIRTTTNDWWIGECDDLAISIMRKFPCGLLPIKENFHVWKKAFAKTYLPKNKGRRKEGMVAGWVDVYGTRRPESFIAKDNEKK